jgi:hypothetical protein
MATNPVSRIELLLDRVKTDASLSDSLKADPVTTLTGLVDQIKREYPSPYAGGDRFAFRLCVIILGITVLTVLGLIGKKYYDLPLTANPNQFFIPEILIAIGSTALGALAGLLAPQPNSR